VKPNCAREPFWQTDDIDELSITLDIYECKGKEVSPIGNAETLVGSAAFGNISHTVFDNSIESIPIANIDAVQAESPITAPPGSLILVDYHRSQYVPEEARVLEANGYDQRSRGGDVEACGGDEEAHEIVPSIGVIDDPIRTHLESSISQPITPLAVGVTLEYSMDGSGMDRRVLRSTPSSQKLELSQPEPEDSLSRLSRGSILEGQRTPAPRSSWRPSDVLPSYGLDAELKAKAEEKYNSTAEDEVAQWVEEITGVQVMGDFGEALRTGQVLCQLVNTIKPGTIKKINAPGRPFKERENITMFIKTCRDWGVHEYALFSTDDLYDEKNLASVVKCIYQLGGVLRRAVPDFLGPHLGVADCSNAKRDTKRDLAPASQTEGFRNAMGRSHIDILSTGNVRAPVTRGGC